ncbi:hypothetical protein Hanom_Chr06g00539631 [Helianthus anomalus]
MSTELCNEFLLLVLQFLDEEKYKETLYSLISCWNLLRIVTILLDFMNRFRLESESRAFCNVDYITELVTNGD